MIAHRKRHVETLERVFSSRVAGGKDCGSRNKCHHEILETLFGRARVIQGGFNNFEIGMIIFRHPFYSEKCLWYLFLYDFISFLYKFKVSPSVSRYL